MVFLTRVTMRTVSRTLAYRSHTYTRRPFHISSIQSGLSESDHSEDNDARKQNIDHHKNDQLNKAKEGKNEWKQEIASNSEAVIKADRGEITASDDEIAKLQQETAKSAEAEHKGTK